MPEILIFTSTTCRFCHILIERIDAILDEIRASGISIEYKEIVVDESDNYLIADEHGIFAVPTIIVGNDRKSGNLTDEEITDLVYKAALLA